METKNKVRVREVNLCGFEIVVVRRHVAESELLTTQSHSLCEIYDIKKLLFLFVSRPINFRAKQRHGKQIKLIAREESLI